MPAPAIKTPTRHHEVEAPKDLPIGPPPAPPAVPKATKPPAAPPGWTPAPLACTDYTVKGSTLRRHLELAFASDLLPLDEAGRTIRAVQLREEIDKEDRQEISRQLRPLIEDEADAALAARVQALAARVQGLDLLTEEWDLRLRRLETEGAPAEEVQQAKEAFVGASEKFEQVQAELSRLREELTGTNARRKRAASEIAARVAAATDARIKDERDLLLRAIADKCSTELTALCAVELRLLQMRWRNRAAEAEAWAAEILAAGGGRP
jgi:hypothetical protein